MEGSPFIESAKNSKTFSSYADINYQMSGSTQSSAPKNKERSGNGFGSSGLETIEDHIEHDDYTEEMNSRMREKFELKIPDIDLIDLDK